MAAQLIANHLENAEVYTDAQLCKQKLNELLKEINIPCGLFPMDNFQEFGYNKSTGFMWFTQPKPVEHKFPKMKKVVSYDTRLTAVIEGCRMKKIQGLKYKEMMIWITLSDVYVEDPSSGKITIANPTGISRALPLSFFKEEEETKVAK